MASMTVKTARRSIDDLLRRLPGGAAVELIKVGAPPIGAAISVKIEIGETPADLMTHNGSDAREAEIHPTHEDSDEKI